MNEKEVKYEIEARKMLLPLAKAHHIGDMAALVEAFRLGDTYGWVVRAEQEDVSEDVNFVMVDDESRPWDKVSPLMPEIPYEDFRKQYPNFTKVEDMGASSKATPHRGKSWWGL